jgi:hypothetical protein
MQDSSDKESQQQIGAHGVEHRQKRIAKLSRSHFIVKGLDELIPILVFAAKIPFF